MVVFGNVHSDNLIFSRTFTFCLGGGWECKQTAPHTSCIAKCRNPDTMVGSEVEERGLKKWIL